MTDSQENKLDKAEAEHLDGSEKAVRKGIKISDLASKCDQRRLEAEGTKAELVSIAKLLQAEADSANTVRAALKNISMAPSAQVKALLADLDRSKFAKVLTSFGGMPTYQLKQMADALDHAKAVRSVLSNAGLIAPSEVFGVNAALKNAKTISSVLSNSNLPQMAQLKSLADSFGGAKLARSVLSGAGVLPSEQMKKLVSSIAFESKTFQALASSDGEMWEKLASRIGSWGDLSSVEVDASTKMYHVAPSTDAEVADAIAAGGEFSGISAAAKVWLLRVFFAFMLMQSYFAAQNGVREELCFLQPKLMPSLSIGKTGKAIRAAVCEAEHPVEVLKNFRLVRGVNVNLREQPSMKAGLVEVYLEDHATLEVLDDTNRDWLQVSIVGQENVTGWISRKYTRTLYR